MDEYDKFVLLIDEAIVTYKKIEVIHTELIKHINAHNKIIKKFTYPHKISLKEHNIFDYFKNIEASLSVKAFGLSNKCYKLYNKVKCLPDNLYYDHIDIKLKVDKFNKLIDNTSIYCKILKKTSERRFNSEKKYYGPNVMEEMSSMYDVTSTVTEKERKELHNNSTKSFLKVIDDIKAINIKYKKEINENVDKIENIKCFQEHIMTHGKSTRSFCKNVRNKNIKLDDLAINTFYLNNCIQNNDDEINAIKKAI